MKWGGPKCAHLPKVSTCPDCFRDLLRLVETAEAMAEAHALARQEVQRRAAALLAVAKAVDKASNEVQSPLDWSDVGYIFEAMEALDAAHPGWREWTP